MFCMYGYFIDTFHDSNPAPEYIERHGGEFEEVPGRGGGGRW